MTREEHLERALCKCWGAMLLASTVTDDPKIQAAFAKVDQECRKVPGVAPREGMRFIEEAA